MRPDPQAFADVIVTAIKTAQAPLLARLEVLEAKPVVPPSDIPPEDIAASVAGLLRKELADLEIPTRTQKRIVRNDAGQIERVIEESV